jgi:hypothetical protein
LPCSNFSNHNHPGNLLSSSTLSRKQFSQSNSHNQSQKYCHHYHIVRLGQSQVQELRIRKLCHPSEQSC